MAIFVLRLSKEVSRLARAIFALTEARCDSQLSHATTGIVSAEQNDLQAWSFIRVTVNVKQYTEFKQKAHLQNNIRGKTVYVGLVFLLLRLL